MTAEFTKTKTAEPVTVTFFGPRINKASIIVSATSRALGWPGMPAGPCGAAVSAAPSKWDACTTMAKTMIEAINNYCGGTRKSGADRFATTSFDRERVATFPSFGGLLHFWFSSS